MYTACLHYQNDILYLKYTLVPATGHQEQKDLKHHELQTKTDGLVKLEFDKNVELYNIVSTILLINNIDSRYPVKLPL